MKNISVHITVYNEEKRIENFIKSFLWSDDILIVVRSDTDDKTREIAAKYPVRIVETPYKNLQEEGELKLQQSFIASLRNEWVMLVTASDLIHPKLVNEVLRLINDEEFDSDVIKGPGNRYVLGMNNKRSPWFAGYNKWCIAYKKSAFELTSKVHEEVKITSSKIYTVSFARNEQQEGFFHLTHQTLDSAIERSLRYCKTGEALKYDDESIALKTSFIDVLKSVIKVIFREKTWLLGWDGIAITFNYLIYYMLKYLYIWDKFKGPEENVYDYISESILKEWDIYYNSKYSK